MLFRQHILVVTNSLSIKDAEQIRQTIDNYPDAQIKLSLVYIMPNIPLSYYQLPSITSLKSQMLMDIKGHLKAIAAIMGVCENDQWIKSGKLKIEAQQLAQSLNVDLVISDSLASVNVAPAVDPILTKKLWRQPGKVSSQKFKDYLSNFAAYTIPTIIA